MSVAVRTQKFEAIPRTIGDFCQSGERYVIPVFQRSYSWGMSQVAQLMQDLLDFFAGCDKCKNEDPAQLNKEFYSLGTIVCECQEDGSGEKVFSILDGQQRITTIDLILSEITCNKEGSARLISAYQYLSEYIAGDAHARSTGLPDCAIQMKIIRAKLDKIKREKEEKDDDFLNRFRRCLLERVIVSRVVLPIAEGIENEAPKMFEIINMRGQKLSELDQLKARFLQCLGESDDRKVFTSFWNTFENCLCTKNKFSYSVLKNKADASTGENGALTLSEILSPTCALRMVNTVIEAETSELLKSNWVPPIDMMNILVMANELLKNIRNEESGEIDAEKFRALTTHEIQGRFDWICQSSRAKENIWRLMSIVSIISDLVTAWGPYRSGIKNDEKFIIEESPFDQLIISFMAYNSYQTSGQYWLLLLSGIAVKEYIRAFDFLPASSDKFIAIRSLNFKRLKIKAFSALIIYGARSAVDRAVASTQGVMNLIPQVDRGEISLSDPFNNKIENKVGEWNYNSGMTQWNLYFLDWMLWCDYRVNDSIFLKNAMDNFMINKDKSIIDNALRSFDWQIYFKKASQVRIVSRGAIEHWRARDNAQLKENKEDVLKELHGFGNLALIDDSANSSLGKMAPKDKSQEVLNRMSNPAMKLLWLAAFSQNIENFWGDVVVELTKFWGKYMQDYNFAKICGIK